MHASVSMLTVIVDVGVVNARVPTFPQPGPKLCNAGAIACAGAFKTSAARPGQVWRAVEHKTKRRLHAQAMSTCAHMYKQSRQHVQGCAHTLCEIEARVSGHADSTNYICLLQCQLCACMHGDGARAGACACVQARSAPVCVFQSLSRSVHVAQCDDAML